MAAYLKQKRALPGLVQASDLQIYRPKSGVRVGSREVHAYDGPLHFIGSLQNPDQLNTSTITKNNSSQIKLSHSQHEIGKWLDYILFYINN